MLPLGNPAGGSGYSRYGHTANINPEYEPEEEKYDRGVDLLRRTLRGWSIKRLQQKVIRM